MWVILKHFSLGWVTSLLQVLTYICPKAKRIPCHKEQQSLENWKVELSGDQGQFQLKLQVAKLYLESLWILKKLSVGFMALSRCLLSHCIFNFKIIGKIQLQC